MFVLFLNSDVRWYLPLHYIYKKFKECINFKYIEFFCTNLPRIPGIDTDQDATAAAREKKKGGITSARKNLPRIPEIDTNQDAT